MTSFCKLSYYWYTLHMRLRDSAAFDRVMYFKFFMVIFVWGLIPLLIPQNLIPLLGFNFNATQIMLLRLWGVIVLLDTFLYVFIFRHRNHWLTKYLLLFSVADNGGIGVLLLLLTFILHWPWGVWINIPFQLFFGYWFYRFYKDGGFECRDK